MGSSSTGRYWMIILSTCLVFGSLGYFELCRSGHAGNPAPAIDEYGYLTSPEAIARVAWSSGNRQPVKLADLTIVRSAQDGRRVSGRSRLGVGSIQNLQSSDKFTPYQTTSHNARDFVARYNRELVRLKNR